MAIRIRKREISCEIIINATAYNDENRKGSHVVFEELKKPQISLNNVIVDIGLGEIVDERLPDMAIEEITWVAKSNPKPIISAFLYIPNTINEVK